jgi:hypothetical protein
MTCPVATMGEPAPEPSAHTGRWEIVRARPFSSWFHRLDPEQAMQVSAAMRRVAADGPTLGRPRVDSIHGSHLHNLKELRLHQGIRVLFAFDPDRRAVMLVGGDKTGSWNRWYRAMIPVAERVYADHLRSIGKGDRCLGTVTARSQEGRNR